MKNEKTKFIGVNLILLIPSAAFVYLSINLFMPWFNSLIISAIFYIYDVINQSRVDYLESEIDKLKEKQN